MSIAWPPPCAGYLLPTSLRSAGPCLPVRPAKRSARCCALTACRFRPKARPRARPRFSLKARFSKEARPAAPQRSEGRGPAVQRSAAAERLRGRLDARRAEERVGRRRAAGRSNHLLHPTLRHPRRGGPGVGARRAESRGRLRSSTSPTRRIVQGWPPVAQVVASESLISNRFRAWLSPPLADRQLTLSRDPQFDRGSGSTRRRIAEAPCRSDGAGA
jgi:hypothetical protein